MRDTKGNTMLIGEAAEYLNVSVKTLRRWEKSGLVTPLRNAQNQRAYSRHQLQPLKGRKNKPLPQSSQPSPKLYSISEAAQVLGVSIKTIRRWDEANKINSIRNAKNQRMFTHTDLMLAKNHRHQLLDSISINRVETPLKPAPTSTPIYSNYLTIIILTITSTLLGISLTQKLVSNLSDPLSDPLRTVHNNSSTSTYLSPDLDSTSPPLALTEENKPEYSGSTAFQSENITDVVSTRPSQDLEIDTPMTFTDLNLALNSNSEDDRIQLAGDELKHGTLPRVSEELLYTHPAYAVYTLPVPMPQAENNPLSVLAISPSGRQLHLYAEPATADTQWLIRFIPDETGVWKLQWYATSQSLEGSQEILVTP